HFVYRLTADNKVDVVPVKVLSQDSDQTLISGPRAGDVLVSDGQSRLRPGATVEVLTPPAAVVASAQVVPETAG
ncbi:efflux RND transporter periplasmic adaptor subunit, partial [Pseudomonas syringae]